MRFGYVTYGLDRPIFGIGRSVFELGRTLAERHECEPLFLTPYRRGPFRDHSTAHARMRGARLLPGLMSIGAVEVAWLARQHHLPLVHDPTGVGPFLPGRWSGSFKRVVTVHDATPLRFPNSHNWLTRFIQRRYLPATLPNVDAVITLSEASKKDLMRFLHVPARKVHVVPCGVSGRFRPATADAIAAVKLRYGLQSPFVLYVGALEPRKNLPTLMRAIARLMPRHPNITLVVAGRPRWGTDVIPRTVDELGLQSIVQFTGYVAEADLPALYSAASVFCFPSIFEGFGLPVLEAMACGTPVVCSAMSSLPEVAGDAALLVDPKNDEELASALDTVLRDANEREALRQRGVQRAAQFTWNRVADQTLAVYRQVLAEA